MTHRVLLDFTCAFQILGPIPADVRVSNRSMTLHEAPLIRRLRHYLVMSGWESQYEDEATGIFNQMAEQLPADDLPSFVRHTKFTMDRKAPKAYLTASYFVDADVGRVRLRIGSASEAVLVDLGRLVAAGTITALPELELKKMELFEARSDSALLSGSETLEGDEPYRFFSRDNLTVWAPFLFSAMFITFGLASLSLASAPWETSFFDGAFGQWYGRLVGPTGMAIVTTLSIAASDFRRTPQHRIVEWDLRSSPTN